MSETNESQSSIEPVRIDSLPKPTNQPDADGRVIRGRDGTHHWQEYMANADLGDYHHAPAEAVEAFKDMKYGIRIHWGIYSIVHGHESWVLRENARNEETGLAYQGFYHDLYKAWNPAGFDADKWTQMMVDNQFKFFVFTTKHHDGFSMYDTQATIRKKTAYFGPGAGSTVPFNQCYSVMETPFGRDVTGELVSSARKRGLKIGLYFSHPDWFDAAFRFDEWNPNRDENLTPDKQPEIWRQFRTRHQQQIREILTNYGTVDLLSLDMWMPDYAWQDMQDAARLARELQPECMLRWRGIGNYGDYHSPENYIPSEESQGTMAWQVIHALSTKKCFAYEPDPSYLRDGQWIVSKLIDIVSKGGNLMIGVGPDLAGNWHPAVLETLEYAADWLKVNGEAIFETRPCDTVCAGNTYFTRNKTNTITYAISVGWPGHDLCVPNMAIETGSPVFLLGYDIPLDWEKNEGDIIIKLPKALQIADNRPCKQAYAFKIIGSQV